MKKILAIALFSMAFLLSAPVRAQQTSCTGGGSCVDSADMAVFLEALKEKKCLLSNHPGVTSDPVQIVIDRQGRVFGSGSDPKPFTIHLTWCSYTLDAVGQTQIIAGQEIPPTYGLRFRPKATIGLLGTELVTGSPFQDSVDAGVLLEPFYFFTDFNVNAYVGVRSVGGGLGFDLTRNMGAFAGYVATWSQFRSNPMIALYFSLW